MDRQAYRDEILTILSGCGVLEIELDSTAIDKILNSAFREIQRYIDTTKLVTVPYSRCIDVSAYNISSVARVFRTEGYGDFTYGSTGNAPVDPMLVNQWQLLNGVGNMRGFSNFVSNYASWNMLAQIRNTMSTDMAFRYDKMSNKLYVNVSTGIPSHITIEYIPQFQDVSEIVSDYWIDMLIRLSVALAKVSIGRIRTMFKQTNALWTLDGDQMLNEGNAELSDIREKLLSATQLSYPID